MTTHANIPIVSQLLSMFHVEIEHSEDFQWSISLVSNFNRAFIDLAAYNDHLHACFMHDFAVVFESHSSKFWIKSQQLLMFLLSSSSVGPKIAAFIVQDFLQVVENQLECSKDLVHLIILLLSKINIHGFCTVDFLLKLLGAASQDLETLLLLRDQTRYISMAIPDHYNVPDLVNCLKDDHQFDYKLEILKNLIDGFSPETRNGALQAIEQHMLKNFWSFLEVASKIKCIQFFFDFCQESTRLTLLDVIIIREPPHSVTPTGEELSLALRYAEGFSKIASLNFCERGHVIDLLSKASLYFRFIMFAYLSHNDALFRKVIQVELSKRPLDLSMVLLFMRSCSSYSDFSEFPYFALIFLLDICLAANAPHSQLPGPNVIELATRFYIFVPVNRKSDMVDYFVELVTREQNYSDKFIASLQILCSIFNHSSDLFLVDEFSRLYSQCMQLLDYYDFANDQLREKQEVGIRWLVKLLVSLGASTSGMSFSDRLLIFIKKYLSFESENLVKIGIVCGVQLSFCYLTVDSGRDTYDIACANEPSCSQYPSYGHKRRRPSMTFVDPLEMAVSSLKLVLRKCQSKPSLHFFAINTITSVLRSLQDARFNDSLASDTSLIAFYDLVYEEVVLRQLSTAMKPVSPGHMESPRFGLVDDDFYVDILSNLDILCASISLGILLQSEPTSELLSVLKAPTSCKVESETVENLFCWLKCTLNIFIDCNRVEESEIRSRQIFELAAESSTQTFPVVRSSSNSAIKYSDTTMLFISKIYLTEPQKEISKFYLFEILHQICSQPPSRSVLSELDPKLLIFISAFNSDDASLMSHILQYLLLRNQTLDASSQQHDLVGPIVHGLWNSQWFDRPNLLTLYIKLLVEYRLYDPEFLVKDLLPKCNNMNDGVLLDILELLLSSEVVCLIGLSQAFSYVYCSHVAEPSDSTMNPLVSNFISLAFKSLPVHKTYKWLFQKLLYHSQLYEKHNSSAATEDGTSVADNPTLPKTSKDDCCLSECEYLKILLLLIEGCKQLFSNPKIVSLCFQFSEKFITAFVLDCFIPSLQVQVGRCIHGPPKGQEDIGRFAADPSILLEAIQRNIKTLQVATRSLQHLTSFYKKSTSNLYESFSCEDPCNVDVDGASNIHEEESVPILADITNIMVAPQETFKSHSNVTASKYIPALKRSLETLLFKMKSLLERNNLFDLYYLGNLKHRDVQGQEILTQM